MSYRVLIIHGNDRYLSNYHLQQAAEAVPGDRVTLDVTEQGDKLPALLKYHLQARSLFGAGARVITVTGLHGLAPPAELGELLNHHTKHLVIWIEHAKIPSLQKITAKLTVPFQVVEASVPNYQALQAWGNRYYQQETKQPIPAPLWPLLMKAASQIENNKIVYSTGALAQILDKLKLMQEPGTALTSAQVEAVIEQSAPVTVWQWLDSLFVNRSATKTYLTTLLEHGTDPLFLFNLLADHIRSLLLIAYLVDSRTPRPIITSTLAKFGKPPFLTDKLHKLYENSSLTDQQLQTIHFKLTHFDRQIKQGEIEPSMALELLLLRL